MSTGRQTVGDLLEEAKKRIVLVAVSVVGLSYLMSLTSSSVWVNLPAAASLIFLLRYISLDLDMKRRAATYNKNSATTDRVLKQPQEGLKVGSVDKSNWRRKVNSPVVEDAINLFSNHLISEWMTDLWYSRLTPDKDAPEELVHIINDVFGEISCRAREINLIDLLTRDVVNVIRTHLELSRISQAKIEEQKLGDLGLDQRDAKLKLILASENKLHPALFSAQAEHRVLQYLMDGLISFTFNPADLQCSLFRYMVRELLACTVIRPVLNLASPRFVNEKIESFVIARKADKGATPSEQELLRQKPNVSSRTSSDQLSGSLGPSVKGVELVQFKHDKTLGKETANGNPSQKDPLLSVDPRSSRSWNSLPSQTEVSEGKDIHRHHSGGEWGQMLDVMSQRKTQALAPEHFENMWTKGKHYKRKEGVSQSVKQTESSLLDGNVGNHPTRPSKPKLKDKSADNLSKSGSHFPQRDNGSKAETLHPPYPFYEHDLMGVKEVESNSDSSYTTEDDDTSGVTGLDSPGTKVWDSKNNRNAAVSHIRHPLESSEGHLGKKIGKGHGQHRRAPRTKIAKRRSRLGADRLPTWQEVERTSFLLGEGQDILHTSKGVPQVEESSDEPESEIWGRVNSGAAASSSAPITSLTNGYTSTLTSPENSVIEDSFLKLRCEVLGANIVKSGSKTFAVYSISVTDADNIVWSIKRRFRHFEELHRRLKEFSEYKLSLPPKHFLSSGLEANVVQERCHLLDRYLKKLLQLPTISGSIEVWDFLSVDSQTYMFSNSLSIIQTLSVDFDDKPYEKSTHVPTFVDGAKEHLSRKEHLSTRSKTAALREKLNSTADTSRLKPTNAVESSLKFPSKEVKYLSDDTESDSDSSKSRSTYSDRKSEKSLDGRGNDGYQEGRDAFLDVGIDPTLPTEWIPPNLSVPILDLVDSILQIQDGGWIRRQAFWVAKQVLQLGMGDAFDDWLIEKIRFLRMGSVIASGIKRVEQILWPDGIFITKHPKRQRPPQAVSQPQSPLHKATDISSPRNEDAQNGFLTDEQQREEASRRAHFVYELMIDNAPAAVVGVLGRTEYEMIAKDLYYFLQSSVCLKQFAYGILELLLVSAFPEFDQLFKNLHQDKHKFGTVEVEQ
ncbi:hypothetical protein ACHQM5_002225 [Ranunculus cassubicifolius]